MPILALYESAPASKATLIKFFFCNSMYVWVSVQICIDICILIEYMNKNVNEHKEISMAKIHMHTTHSLRIMAALRVFQFIHKKQAGYGVQTLYCAY